MRRSAQASRDVPTQAVDCGLPKMSGHRPPSPTSTQGVARARCGLARSQYGPQGLRLTRVGARERHEGTKEVKQRPTGTHWGAPWGPGERAFLGSQAGHMGTKETCSKVA